MFLQLSHHYSNMKLETKNITLWRTCCGADQGQISSVHRKKIENLAVLSFDFSHLTVNLCLNLLILSYILFKIKIIL